MGPCQSKQKQQVPVRETVENTKSNPRMTNQQNQHNNSTVIDSSGPFKNTNSQQQQRQPSTNQNNNIRTSQNEDYPQVFNYGGSNYHDAPNRQTQDVLHDEDQGYYAANGRNVSVRVDMNS